MTGFWRNFLKNLFRKGQFFLFRGFYAGVSNLIKVQEKKHAKHNQPDT
jgi:hypothetical protein